MFDKRVHISLGSSGADFAMSRQLLVGDAEAFLRDHVRNPDVIMQAISDDLLLPLVPLMGVLLAIRAHLRAQQFGLAFQATANGSRLRLRT